MKEYKKVTMDMVKKRAWTKEELHSLNVLTAEEYFSVREMFVDRQGCLFWNMGSILFDICFKIPEWSWE